MYSVNPLEATTIKSIRRGTSLPRQTNQPSLAVSPSAPRRTTSQLKFSTSSPQSETFEPYQSSPSTPRVLPSRRRKTPRVPTTTEAALTNPTFQALATTRDSNIAPSSIFPANNNPLSFDSRRPSTTFISTPRTSNVPLPTEHLQQNTFAFPTEQPSQPRSRVRVRVKKPTALKPTELLTNYAKLELTPPQAPVIRDESLIVPLNISSNTPLRRVPGSVQHVVASNPQLHIQSFNNILNKNNAEQVHDTLPEALTTISPPREHPFLLPQATPTPNLPRYSRLLNRYALLDEISPNPDINSAPVESHSSNYNANQEISRAVRQPQPDNIAPIAPSARNFETQTLIETSTNRPRRRRLKTTTTTSAVQQSVASTLQAQSSRLPSTFDGELSDSQDVFVSQPPNARFRPASKRFATKSAATTPSTLITTTPLTSELPSVIPASQGYPLLFQTQSSRPLFSSLRRKNTPQIPSTTLKLLSEPELASSTTPSLTSEVVTHANPLPSSPLPPPTTKFGRFGKQRPLFTKPVPTTTEPLPTAEAETLPSQSDVDLNNESLRLSSGITAFETATPIESFDSTEIPKDASITPQVGTEPQEISNRVRKFKPRFGSSRFSPRASVTTTVPSTTEVVTQSSSTTTVIPAVPVETVVPPQSQSKFKPRKTFRRTTTPPPTTTTTTEPSSTVPLSSIVIDETTTSIVTESSIPKESGRFPFKHRPSKFRSFPVGATQKTNTESIFPSTFEEIQPTTTVETQTVKQRKTFPRFQDTIKRSTTVPNKIIEATTQSIQTSPAERQSSTGFTKPAFKPRPTFSRFQSGAARTTTPPLSTEIVDQTSASVTLPPLQNNEQPLYDTIPPERFVSKARPTASFASRSTPYFASTIASNPSSGILSVTNSPTIPTDISGSLEASETPFTSKRRRRPVSKKLPEQDAQTFSFPTSPFASISENIQDTFAPQRVPTDPSLNSEANFYELPSTTALPPPNDAETPNRRKFRRRKLSVRSTQAMRDEQEAASEITTWIANITTSFMPSTSEINKDTISSITSVDITTTPLPVLKSKDVKETLSNNDNNDLKLHTKRLRGKQTKEQYSGSELFNLDDPLVMEADETGDDSGVWFSDSSSFATDSQIYSRGSGSIASSDHDKNFQIEQDGSSVHSPSSSQIRQTLHSDTDDSKSWFGLADESVQKTSGSIPDGSEGRQDEIEGPETKKTNSKVNDDLVQKEPLPPSDRTSESDSQGTNSKKSASFSVSSSVSFSDDEPKNNKESQSIADNPPNSKTEADPKGDENFKIEEGSPKIIIIDKVSLHDDVPSEKQGTDPETTHTDDGDMPRVPPLSITSDVVISSDAEGDVSEDTTSPATTTTQAAPDTKDRETGRGSSRRNGTSTVKSSASRSSRRDKNVQRSSSRSRTSNSENVQNSRSQSSSSSSSRRSSGSRRNRPLATTSTTSTTTTTTTLPSTTTEITIDIETTTKKSSDEVGYFGEEEVAPVSHGVLDGPSDEFERGAGDFLSYDSDKGDSADDGEVASAGVSEHNTNDGRHKSESATSDDSAIWELSPLSEFSGPIRQSPSFNVEVRSKAPKLIQLASRRETKSTRSDISDEFSEKPGSRNKMRNFLKMIGFHSLSDAQESGTSQNATQLSLQRPIGANKQEGTLNKFAYPVPIKTPEDIAELFEMITSAPSEFPKPFQPPPKTVILKLNKTSAEINSTMEEEKTTTTIPHKLQPSSGPKNCSRGSRNVCPTTEDYPRYGNMYLYV